MRAPVPKYRHLFPARTFIIDAAVDHPLLPFVQALQQEKFRITSEPGQSPVTLRYGNFWKSVVGDSEFVVTAFLPEKLQRWELDIDVYIDAARDEHGNHAITVTGYSSPRRGNNFLFETVAKAAEAFSQSGKLLHWTEFFEGDPTGRGKVRRSRKSKGQRLV